MNSLYQNKKTAVIWLLFFFTGFWSNNVISQTTIATTGTNYTGTTLIAPGTPGAITFVIQNTNAQLITLRQVDCYAAADQLPKNVYKLWYSTTSLSGAPTIAAPTWTLIATGDSIPAPATDGIITVLNNINFLIPAGAQYRFALETSNGIRYSGSAAVTPTPNTFTSDGVNLKVGNASVGGNVGYGGAFPNPINNPRFFTGRITFVNGLLPCNQPTLPTLSPDTSLCSGSSATLSVTGGSLNEATNWKWYTSSCGGTIAGTGTSLTVTPTATTSYYVRGEGGCAAAGACDSVTVTVKPLPGVPAINPVTPVCINSARALTINPIAVTTGNVMVSSGTIAIAVPDNTPNGVTSTLTLTDVPAGAVITGIDVRLNMTHTYVSDMIFNLKAPNGSILALDKYLTATGNEGEDFLNTIISSAGTAILSDGIPPFTGTFAPDAINTPIGTAPVQNPAGFVSNAANFAALYSVPNGVWTLAMADGGPLDLGLLTEWAITINYTVSATAYPAVWTPSSTLFTDAAATVPYDGITPSFTVYAAPTITTTYTALSVNSGCSSTLPATVMVTVNNPAAITANGHPSAAEICESGSALFGVITTGTPPSYQWQVDDGSGTFVNLADNSNYAGTTSDTLVVKNAPASFTGYLYRSIVSSAIPCAIKDTTEAAKLTVNKTPAIALGVSPYFSLLPGLSTTITANVDSAVASYSWFRNGAVIASAATQNTNVTIDGLGVYKSTVIDINGCTVTSGEVTIKDSVSSKLFIYPNPNNGKFQVRYYSVAGNILPRQLAIYDAKGALVMNKDYKIGKPYDHMDVDFSHLSSGVYIVQLLDHNANRLAFGKVVVNK